MTMNLKSLEHERRFVKYKNKSGYVYNQFCYIRYVGKNHIVIYKYYKAIRVSRNKILSVTTPKGKSEYEIKIIDNQQK